ncbi:hypothetical protein HD600_002525 [Microbacterium ginsengiterrae]|uniref:Uncharacterized protein n=1 Tax=Microbacterium ginsengiterrae TaxID=546115 RepID=A0A7W9FDY6_9MICO|nr:MULTISPECIES: hypothetical protein [Microbacterium]MBB5744028.1 hypothetical protein [Microbacterium ginsengiterrae]
MSNDTLLRSTLHPPCPQTQEVVEVTVPINRKELALTDRLSLRFGLWLLLRAERSRRRTPRTLTQEEMMLLQANRRQLERESLAMLTYGLQRFGR